MTTTWEIIHRRIVASIVAITLLVAGIAVVQPQPAQATPPARVMVVGDSISNGQAGDWTWRYRLWQHEAGSIDFVGPYQTVFDQVSWTQTSGYLDPAFDKDHDAISGRTTEQARATIASEVVTYQPDVLIINLGTNDIGFFNHTTAQAIEDMRFLIVNAVFARPGFPLRVVLSLLTPNLSAGDWVGYRAGLIALAGEMQAVGLDLVIADPLTVGYNATSDNWDGVHPAPSGEFKLASIYANALAGWGIGTPYGSLPVAPAWPVAPVVDANAAYNRYVVVQWAPAVGSKYYIVYYRAAGSSDPYVQVPVEGAAAANYYVTGQLVNNQTYEFAMSTVRGYVVGPMTPLDFVTAQNRPRPLTARLP